MQSKGWAFGALAVVLGSGLLLLDDPEPAPPFAHFDTPNPSLSLVRAPDSETALQEAFIGFLSGDAGNLAAEETARFLKTHAVRLHLHDPGSSRVMAEYDSEAGRLNLNPARTVRRGMLDASGPVSDETSLNLEATIAGMPFLLQEYVDVASRLVVHETRHGAYTEALGTNWNSREQELACRSYETLFLLRRLQNERDFLRLEEFDRLMLDQFSRDPLTYGPVEFERPERWWTLPLGDVGIADVERAAKRIRDRFPGTFADELEYHWYLLHRVGEGADAYWRTLDSLIPADYDSVDQDWPAHLRAMEDAIRGLKARLRRAQDDEDTSDLRRQLEALQAHLESNRAFLASQERVDAYRAYFRMEKRRLGLLLQAAAKPV